jgi:pimeloyl-ACP methyl ester carboxylesterase
MIDITESRGVGASTRISTFFLAAMIVFCQTAAAKGERAPLGAGDNSSAATAAGAMPPVIVFGFVGGFVKHDDPIHDEVRLAARLRKSYPSGVDVETFENSRGEIARKKILSLLDADHDGTLTEGEKQNARIILYGHSWGASEAIALARELKNDGIPVLLTVQIDSVSKFHQDDAVIPANVAQAVNFYQPDGFVHGQSEIRAADPGRTKIIGNFRFDYKASPYACNQYPWWDRLLVKAHTQIECDPNVWKQAEALIRLDLPPISENGSGL